MTDWTDILDHWPVLLLGALVVVPFLYVAYCDWSYSRATRRSLLVHDLSGPEAKALILGLADIIVGTQPDEWAADKLLALRWARRRHGALELTQDGQGIVDRLKAGLR